jgi:hypothetical protein
MPITKDIGGGTQLVDIKGIEGNPLEQTKDTLGLVDLANRIQQAPADLAKKQADAAIAQNQASHLDAINALQDADLQSKRGIEQRARVDQIQKVALSLPEVFSKDFETGKLYAQAAFPGSQVKKNDDGTVSMFVPSPDGVRTLTVPHQQIDDPQKLAEVEKGIRQQWMESPQFKGYQTVNEFHRNFSDTISLATGAGDAAALFSYVKMLDRNNQAREGQIDSMRGIPGVTENMLNLYQRATDTHAPVLGEANSQTRKDFIQSAGKLYQNSYDDAAQQGKFFGNLAQRSFMDPKNVVVPVGAITFDSLFPKTNKVPGTLSQDALQSLRNGTAQPPASQPGSLFTPAAPPPSSGNRFKTTDDLLRNNLFKTIGGQ